MAKFKIIAIIIILLIVGVGGYFLFGNYSDGYRAGTMIKFSKRGVLFKTYEGELNLGMVLNDQQPSVSVSNIWKFSVQGSEDELKSKLQNALLNGKRVKVHYNEKFFQFDWRGDTKYIVDEVEILD
ncbi:MAG: hypothetical protein NVV82_14445 [Sporocytophaga sp.]|nr:hypothetical protein [Sporocytophaga sp.]